MMPFILGCADCGAFPTGEIAFGSECPKCAKPLRAWMLAPDCFTPKPGLVPVRIAASSPERGASVVPTGDAPADDATPQFDNVDALRLWARDLSANDPHLMRYVRLFAEIDRLKSRLTAARADREDAERWRALREQYVAADFEYPQFEGHASLIFALPRGAKASANLDATIDDMRAARRSQGATNG